MSNEDQLFTIYITIMFRKAAYIYGVVSFILRPRIFCKIHFIHSVIVRNTCTPNAVDFVHVNLPDCGTVV